MIAPQKALFEIVSENNQTRYHLAYDDWGNAQDKTPVFCVHGLCNTRHGFDDLAKALAAQGRRVLTVDMVGHGESEWSSDPSLYEIAHYAQDCAQMIRGLGLDSVDWIGISMGGLIGMYGINRQKIPVRRLILDDVGPEVPLSATIFMADYIEQNFDESGDKQKEFSASEKAFLAWRECNTQPVGPLSVEQRHHRARYDYRVDAKGRYVPVYDPAIAVNLRRDAEAGKGWEDWALYEKITCPTLVLHGAESIILGSLVVERMRLSGPRARVVEIEGVGHYPALADNHQIEIIQTFLSESPVSP